jgi:NifU-like protein involved in Fe-S cluster formation
MAEGMKEPVYTSEILRLAVSLRGPQPLDREDGRAELRSPTCGSRVTAAVQLDDQARVAALSLQVHACAFGQASSALLEAGARGRARDEIEAGANQLGDWLSGTDAEPDWPGIAALAPARPRLSRHQAILLPFRALLAAIDAAASG